MQAMLCLYNLNFENTIWFKEGKQHERKSVFHDQMVRFQSFSRNFYIHHLFTF